MASAAVGFLVRLGGFVFTSAHVWAVIRRFPNSLPYKFITRALWTPTMMITSFNCNSIDDYVVLGSIPIEEDDFCHIRNEYGVDKIISLNEDWELVASGTLHLQADIERIHLPTPDFNPPSLEVIEDAVNILLHPDGETNRCYVHCKAGKGRSAVVVVCYVMVRYNMNVDKAVSFVKTHRPAISLNEQQLDAIHRYYLEYVLKPHT